MRKIAALAVLILAVSTGCASSWEIPDDKGRTHKWLNPDGEEVSAPETDGECGFPIVGTGAEPKLPFIPKDPKAKGNANVVYGIVFATQTQLDGRTVQVCVPVTVHLFVSAPEAANQPQFTDMHPADGRGKDLGNPYDGLHHTPVTGSVIVLWQGNNPPKVTFEISATYQPELDILNEDSALITLGCRIYLNDVPLQEQTSISVNDLKGKGNPNVKNSVSGPFVKCRIDGIPVA